MKKSIILTFLIFVIIPSFANSQSYFEINKNDLDGSNIKLSELLNNGPVMISFWALWCAPCKEEINEMSKIYEKYMDQGFTYLAINLDNQKSFAKVKAFINAQGYKFPVMLDPEKEIFEAYNGRDMPYSLLIDENKNIVAKHTGYLTGDHLKLEKEIIEALEKSKKASESDN
jgi:cytochrome c biogenesis protein CcmG, thiol:disulfide interchange protein DsbE